MKQTVYISCVDEARYSFVSHLSDALRREGISVFVDSDDLFSKEAQEKVERARVSVIVLPGNREVCLEKLTKVLSCQRVNDQVVVPVLCGDSKWHQEWLKALDVMGLSPVYHQSRKDSESVQEIVESELVGEIVRDVNEKLSYMGRIGIYSKLLEIENMVNEQPLGIRCLGIWGMPGIGKTTLAKAFFGQVSGEFDAACFIEDFDKAIHEKRIYRILVEQLKLGNGGKLSLRRDELISKRVLIVLDDVHNSLFAESFLEEFEWFGPESLIIITSRDKRMFRLFCQVNNIYEVQGLNEEEARQLFLLCASTTDMGDQNLQEISVEVLNYAKGNPLAISIYGNELINLSEMEPAFQKLTRRPPLEFVDAFKSSYDALSDSEKNIFLDIACFFLGENVDYVKRLLEGCGFFPHVGINVLVDKCLVTISENRVQMHNLTRDVGREIVNKETELIERRNRLWEPGSIQYLLEDNEQPTTTSKRAQGTEEIEGIFLDTLNLSIDVKTAAFENMLNLRLLKIYCSSPEVRPVINFREGLHSLPNELRLLHWENYPLQSLPQSFDPMHLVEINMPHSQLQKLWDGTKNLEMLRTIKLCHCQQLLDIGDLSKAQNIEVIDLQGCTKLQSFPATGRLLQLRVVNLSGCTEIKSFSEVPPNIEKLLLQGTGIKGLPLSFVKSDGEELVSLLAKVQGLDALELERLTNLVKSSSSSQDPGKLICLELKDCSRLQSLPNMGSLEFIKVLDLSGCSKLETIQDLPRNLKELYLAGTAVREVPQLPQSLELLDAHGCSSLKSIRLDSEKVPMHCTLINCFNLSPQVLNEFLVKALANVKHTPREHQQELNKALAFSFCAPSHANKYSSLDLQPGSSVMTQLTSSWRSTLVGFAMIVEVAFPEDCYDATGFGISCVCRWKSKEGNSHRFERFFHCCAPGEALGKLQKNHIFAFFDVKMRPITSEGNDPDILADLVVFEFFPVNKERNRLDDGCTVTRCGVYMVTATDTSTSLTMSSHVPSMNPLDFSGNEVQEVLRFRYDGLHERDKALFLYIACLFNDDDVDLLAPLTDSIDLGVRPGLKVLANRSLIHILSNGEIMMHRVLRKFGREILQRRSMQPGSSKEFTQDFEKVSMASSSTSLSRNWKYDVFPSFSGLDVRKTLISHVLVSLKRRLINVFKDTEMDIGQEISSRFSQAIRESRISIVVLSKNYASSAWQLDELVEIMMCREDFSQIVIPIFYDIEPSDVKKQRGDFGRGFDCLCDGKTENVREQWRQALTRISTIVGYHSLNWANEADMIDAVTRDVSDKLNITASKDFGNFVDIEDHISKMYSLLCLESEAVRIVGIWGPLGIGKSTIARALEKRIACHFQESIFVDKAFAEKIFDNYRGANLVDDDTKLQLQTQFVYEILGHTNIEAHHLGLVRDTLKDQKVLIILDDVRDLVLLEALVGQTQWFGLGSRIIVITEDKKLLYSHGIDLTYQVDFPSEKQALQMFCRSAFRQNFPPNDFMELAAEAVKLAGNLPLDLNVLGLSLRGRNKEEWMNTLPRLKYNLAGGIEKPLGIRREGLTNNGEVLPSPSPFPMASSYSSHNWRYDVYLSFCGVDVRKSFLSHFLVELRRKSIIDTEMDKEQLNNSLPLQEIRESRISIVIISRNYASSRWPLNELVEITKCKEEFSQKLIPVFYDVEPLDVRKQRGEFGQKFEELCCNKTEDEIQRWHQALNHIANLSGFSSQQWDNDADMIEKIVNVVSDTLNSTPSIDFRDLVGIEAHIAEMIRLLRLESEEVKMVGIWGPTGIGKTTVARALFTHLSSKFQRSAFIVNNKITNLDDYGTKLHFQTRLLSEILGQKDIRIDHLGVMEERLKDQKVLVILDDVDDIRLLDALVGQTRWFGSGSRIIVITKDRGFLKSSYGIDEIYQVGLPSKKQALQMFCRFAFGKEYAPDGFSDLAAVIAETVGNLPLGLKILGSSLRGKDKTEWMAILPLIRDSLYGEIRKIVRVAYERLNEHDKVLFLHIACFFNYDTVEYVTRLLVDRDLNVVAGLTSLAEKSFIHITEHGKVVMYQLQQDLGREIICMESSNEPGGRRFLVDSVDVCDVLVNNSGTETVQGILLDMSGIDKLHISERGFEGMKNLLYLRFYRKLEKKEVKVLLPRGLDYLSHKLRLLHWEAFPWRCMPINFIPEHLVELVMEASKLEELWSGIQPLGSLKCMSLRDSLDLREIPDLSYATNLEKLDLGGCTSLTALPSSIRNLHELRDLDMEGCIKLEVVPTGINLESLYCLNLKGCSQLRSFPDISRNISDLYLDGTSIEEVPCWIDNISRLSYLSMYGCNRLQKISANISKLKLLVEVDFSACKALTEDSWQNHPETTSTSLIRVDISGNNFERLPDTWTSIQPKDLVFSNCRNLVSLPELPASLSMLTANNCESLESLSGSFHSSQTALQFINCFKLNPQARELILQSDCSYAILPGGEIPAYFTHRAAGSSLTVSLPRSSLSKVSSFKACIMVESRSGWFYFGVLWPSRSGSDEAYFSCLTNTPSTRNHLIVFNCNFPPDKVNDSPAELKYSTVKFEFFCLSQTKKVVKIKECGIQLLKVSPYVSVSGQISETQHGDDSGEGNGEETRNSKRIRIA